MSVLADQLADRIQEGATTLANFAKELSDAQWRIIVPRDGRTMGCWCITSPACTPSRWG